MSDTKTSAFQGSRAAFGLPAGGVIVAVIPNIGSRFEGNPPLTSVNVAGVSHRAVGLAGTMSGEFPVGERRTWSGREDLRPK
jgi:hypothetical protein